MEYATYGKFRFHIHIVMAETEDELSAALFHLFRSREENIVSRFADYCLNFPEWVLSAVEKIVAENIDVTGLFSFGDCIEKLHWVLDEKPDLIKRVQNVLKRLLYYESSSVRCYAEKCLFNLDTKDAYEILRAYAVKKNTAGSNTCGNGKYVPRSAIQRKMP